MTAICRVCGGEIPDRKNRVGTCRRCTVEAFNARERERRGLEPRKIVRTGPKRKKQLCETCDNTYWGGCPWFTDHTPVPGWDAEPTTIRERHKDKVREVSSYHIKACPEYREMNRVRK